MNLVRSWARRKRIHVFVCISLGALLGVLSGAKAVQGIERRAAADPTVLWRSGLSPDRPASQSDDPMAREVGYSMAAAIKASKVSRCASLAAEFRSGCRDYVLTRSRTDLTETPEW